MAVAYFCSDTLTGIRTPLCRTSLPKDRFLTTPDGEPGLHFLCAGYQRFFRHVDEPMRVMADLLRRGADATGVRAWYADRDARQGPHDPCTCGSGLEWKRCHGSRTRAPRDATHVAR